MSLGRAQISLDSCSQDLTRMSQASRVHESTLESESLAKARLAEMADLKTVKFIGGVLGK